MPLTLFLARLLGLYCVIIAGVMLVKRRETIAAIEAMMVQPGQIMIAGVFALFGGLAMVLGHNVWSGGVLPIAITLVGWVVTLKAALLLALSSDRLRRLYAALGYDRWFAAYTAATLVLGAALAWAGFTA